MSESIIKQKSYEFALQIIKLCDKLKTDRHFEISSQLLRSGTSIGANVEEVLAGCSERDFYHKMSIASKEARETNYWLRLIRDTNLLEEKNYRELLGKSVELMKILTSIVKTGDEKLKTQNSQLKTQD